MIKITELESPSLDRAKKAPEFWTELAIMEFSRGVRKILRRKGMNQRALAGELGLSEAYISKALSKENITIGQMQKILDPLGAAAHIVVADRRNVVRCREMWPGESRQDYLQDSLGLGESPIVSLTTMGTDRIQSETTV